MDRNDGGPAFPQISVGHYGGVESVTGMTLRDWFAGQALASTLFLDMRSGITEPEISAALAYQMADAMLQARNG